MKKIIYFLLSVLWIHLSSTVSDRIERFSGDNSEELLELYQTGNPYHQFLLEVISANDLAVVTPDFLQTNLDFALKSRELEYCTYDEVIFRHFVLPYRVTQEPIEEWREPFYNALFPLVENAKTIEEAAILVNLWVTEQMTFKQTHGRDQTPLTTIKRGYGRCEESMILYIAAARSVGIPARPASVPFWNFTDNNHAWVEIWTPDGWKYLGEAENALNRAWFSKTTERATLITSQAIGNFSGDHVIKQENNVTTISSIDFYTDSKECDILVLDEQYQPVPEANVFLYAASYGGLFTMARLQTNQQGRVIVPMGNGTVYVTAFKDGDFAASVFPIMETDSLILMLNNEKRIAENLQFQFPIPSQDSNENDDKEILGDEFYVLRENAHLKRKERLSKQARSKEFVPFYQETYWYKIQEKKWDEQKQFLDKCDELAGNAELFLNAFASFKNKSLHQQIVVDMILEWDIKELVEIPDSLSLYDIVDIYTKGKIKNSKVVSDSLFRNHVIKPLWTSAIPPENGWQGLFYEKIKHLSANQLEKTVQNVVKWVDKNVVVDSNFVFSYFSGSLNPLQMLNMKYIPERYRTVLIQSALKQLGVPLQWKGRLEYFNGIEFIALQETKEKSGEEDILQRISVEIFVDEKQTKAEPFSNFLISKLQDNGEISYTFFEGEHDSLTYKATFYHSEEDIHYAIASVRNANGDANIVIEPLEPNDESITFHLTTPVEFVDASLTWSENTLSEVKRKAKNGNYSLLFVLGESKNEPEERMYLQLLEKMAQFEEKDGIFRVFSLRSGQVDFIQESVLPINISESIPENEFPLLFLLDKNRELIFSSKGYTMGIADLLLRKME